MNKEVRRFVARVSAVPGVEVLTGKNHLKVMKDGRFVTSIPKTPSDHRWENNCLAVLRRNGITPRAEPVPTTTIKPPRDPEALRESLRQVWLNPSRGEKTRIAKFIQQYAEANGLRGYNTVEAAVMSLGAFATKKTKKPTEWVLFLLEQSLPHYHSVSRQVDLAEDGGTGTAPRPPQMITIRIELDLLVAALEQLGVAVDFENQG